MQKVRALQIDSYFLQVPEELLDAAKSIRDDGLIQLHHRVKRKGYWLFHHARDANMEIEVVVGKKNVTAYTCDCAKFKDQGLCAHIIAAIQIIIEQRDQERKKTTDPKAPKNLHTRAVINGVSDQELRNFVTQYASQNPHFALMLKAKFAHLIELTDNEEKYYQLCKRFATTLGSKKLSISKINKLVNYIDDLADLSDDLISLSHYREAFDLIFGILRYTSIRYQRYHEIPLEKCLIKIQKKIGYFFTADAAPEFRKSVYEKLTSFLAEKSYSLLDPNNLFNLLFNEAHSQSRRQDIVSHLEQYLRDNSPSVEGAMTLIKFYQSFGRHQDVVDVVIEYKDQYQLILRIFQWLSEKDPSLALYAAEELYEVADGHRLRKFAFDQVCNLGDKTSLQKICIRYFLDHRSAQALETIRKVVPTYANDLLATIASILEDEGDERNLSRILGEMGKTDALMALLQSSPDLNLIISRAKYLYESHYLELESLLLSRFEAFLKVHIGTQSFSETRRIMQQLNRSGMPKLVDALYDMITHEFSERTLLMAAIRELA